MDLHIVLVLPSCFFVVTHCIQVKNKMSNRSGDSRNDCVRLSHETTLARLPISDTSRGGAAKVTLTIARAPQEGNDSGGGARGGNRETDGWPPTSTYISPRIGPHRESNGPLLPRRSAAVRVSDT